MFKVKNKVYDFKRQFKCFIQLSKLLLAAYQAKLK